jgi:ATP-binding cassette, subfamily B, bacterial PglK
MGYLKKFFYVFAGHRQQLFALIGVFVLTSVLEAFGIGLIGPFLTLAENPAGTLASVPPLQWLYGRIEGVVGVISPEQFVVWFGLLLIGIFLIKALIYFVSKRYSYRVLMEQRSSVQERLFKVYIEAPYEFHLTRNTADYINKITNETQRFAFFVSLPLMEAVSHLIVMISLVVLMAKTSWLLLAVAMAALLPAFLVFSLLLKRLKRWGQVAFVAREETIKAVNHGLGGLKETQIFGGEAHFRAELHRHVRQEAQAEVLFQSAQFVPRTLIETLLVVALVGFICLSQLVLARDFQSAVASMGVFAVASLRLIPAASNLAECLGKLRNTSHTLEAMYLDLKEIERPLVVRTAEADRARALPQPVPHGPLGFTKTLRLENVSYQYPGTTQPALSQVSMQIAQGESIGLIGQSGAGKTTLVDVLLGLLPPQGGDIYVDGQSIHSDPIGWNRLVGYIPQSIFLIDNTLEQNVAFGVPPAEIDPHRLWYALEAAQLLDLIEGLPQGIRTSVGERGVRLSGGQRQRIGIARALYHQRQVLVLDEATSALDTETERLISESIRALAGAKTLITIAHRLSTIEHCDRIYVLDRGRIVRSGTYADVVMTTS